ncbi:MAG: hypothetical protein AB8G96_06185 [Phycisphaerales bacterium]
MNGRQVLAWIKGNVVIVIFAIIGIAAVVAIPMLSSKMNASIQAKMKEKLDKVDELARLESTSFSLDEQEWSATVNESLVRDYRAYVEAEAADAQEIVEQAVEHNSKGRTTVMPDLFPVPNGSLEVLPERYHPLIVAAYDELLESVNAGSPPPISETADTLERQRRQFLTGRLQKEEGAVLTQDESEGLREYLAGIRMGLYRDTADERSFYLDRSSLPIPIWNGNPNAYQDMDLLFSWQWDLWMIEDVLRGLATANLGSDSVRLAPVKRVVSLEIFPAMTPAAAGGAGGSTPGPGGRGQAPAPAGPPATPPNESTALPLNFAGSLTGRNSNPLYDIRMARLHLVVETARLPEVFDALAARNFMTVIDADVSPADPYAAIRQGFAYGNSPVSDVIIELETVWLRRWTRELMPRETRARLGVWSAADTPAPTNG